MDKAIELGINYFDTAEVRRPIPRAFLRQPECHGRCLEFCLARSAIHQKSTLPPTIDSVHKPVKLVAFSGLPELRRSFGQGSGGAT